MLERSHIQSTGFRNVGPVGARTGFELRLRQANYRGTRLSLIEGVAITVDGVLYPAAHNLVRIDGRVYTPAELDAATETRLAVGAYMTVIVPRPGGLTPGVHWVESAIGYRHPYFPPAHQSAVARDARHATIVMA